MNAIKIGFAGLSHLGLVYGITMASKGHTLYGFDPDIQLIEDLRRKRLPVFEPGLDDLFGEVANRAHFDSNSKCLAECDIVFVARDVPTDDFGNSDLSELTQLVEQVCKTIPPQTPIVVLSQVNPGYTRKLLSKRRNIYYQVETLIFGRAVERGLYPERYMVGCQNPSDPLPKSYSELLESYRCPILKMRYESAELAKISINFFLVSSVSTTNTLAEVCERIGADWNEIAPALRLDKRIGQFAYLTPGLGIAGGNLERDLITVSKIAATHGTESGLVTSWIRNSRYRKDWAVRTLYSELLAAGGSKNSTVALWGLAYKQDTHSTKNSPALHFAEGIAGLPIRAYDPMVNLTESQRERLGNRFRQVDSALSACDGADALVVLTPWKEFAAISPIEIASHLKTKLVIDPMGLLDEVACRKVTLKHIRMGVGQNNV